MEISMAMRRWLALAALLVAAAASRFVHLDRRPMHADEAVLADKFGSLLEGGDYPYDAREFHGPVLAWCSLPAAWIAGQPSYAELEESTLRAVPAIAGVLLALMPLLLGPVVGRTAAVAAAALAALHPALIYYSQSYIPEMLLALWSAAFLVGIARGAPAWAIGLWFALMLATKETAVLVGVAAAVAYVAAWRRVPSWRGAIVFAAPAVLMLTATGKWRAAVEAARVWGERGITGGGHAHPWHYYLALSGPALVFALAGMVVAFRSGKRVPKFFAAFAACLAVLYSAIPYKTPWCIAGVLFAFAICIGLAVEAIVPRWRIVAAAAVVGIVVWAGYRTDWSYAPTLPSVLAVRDAVDRMSPSGDVPIDVYTRQNLWPLPWYLRRQRSVRWYVQGVPLEAGAAPIVLTTPESEGAVSRRLYEAPPPGRRELYVPLLDRPVEIRRAVEIRAYAAKSLYDSR